MAFTLTFFIPNTYQVKDPAQYDVEINTARGFKCPPSSKSKKINHTIRVKNSVTYDPDQYDLEENIERHIPNW